MRHDGEIPMNPEDMPLDTPPLDASLVYNVALDKVTIVVDKVDNGGCTFFKHTVVVQDGDGEGTRLQQNWTRFPINLGDNATNKQKRDAAFHNRNWARFCAAYGITGRDCGWIPYDVELGDTPQAIESREAFMNFIEKYYGRVAKATIENSEFRGRVRSALQDYVV